ncbi:MAG: hypothetical protein RL662_2373 [Bacteroidota bacterium]|jgi:hypothetical protein
MNDYTNVNKALEMLKSWGSLTLGDKNHSPSLNEQEAYKTIIMSKDPEVASQYFLHQPTRKMILVPKVGMGVTLHYPSDCYPYEITKVVSEQTLEIRAMNYEPIPGWKPDFHPGGFVGHISNLHDQKFTYSSNPNGRITRIRLNKNGRWMNKTIPYSVGEAIYFRNWND